MSPSPAGPPELGRVLIIGGLLAAAVGVALVWGPRIPWLGRLPGDLFLQRDRFTFYFPVATSLLVSILATILLNLFFRR